MLIRLRTRYPATNSTERNKMKTTKELLKNLNRVFTGKDAKTRASDEIKKAQEDSMKGDHKSSEKHFKRYVKLDNVKESTLTQALDILEDLETEDEIAEFLETLDEDTYAGVAATLDEENLDEANKIEKCQDGLNRTLSDKRYHKESTLEKAISNYRSINEGTWTLTSKDGIQKRFKDDKSPEAKAWVSGNQKKEKTTSAKAFASSWIKKNIGDPRVPKSPAVSLDTIWRKVEEVVSNIYPDGDPIDYLGPWCKKQGIDYSMVDKAAKKHGFKDVYAYWDSMSEDLGQL